MKRCLCLLLATLFLAAPAFAASDYPRTPIKVIVPFAAGGGTDSAVRLLAKYIEPHLGQKLGVVNMEGAASTIGSMQVFQAPPDGYTLLFNHTTLLTSYLTGLGLFTWDELTPICNVADFDLVLTVNADAPWKNVQELIEDAKKRPGEIKFGVNMGAGAHFALLALEVATGARFHAVAAGGDAKRTTALLGRHVDVTHPAGSAIIQYVQSGQMRALATFGAKRSPGLEDVPTFKELGIDAVVPFYNSFFGPPGLPQDIVDKLNAAIKKTMENPDYQNDLKKLTLYPDYKDQAEFKKALLQLDTDLYRAARAGGLIPSRIKK